MLFADSFLEVGRLVVDGGFVVVLAILAFKSPELYKLMTGSAQNMMKQWSVEADSYRMAMNQGSDRHRTMMEALFKSSQESLGQALAAFREIEAKNRQMYTDMSDKERAQCLEMFNRMDDRYRQLAEAFGGNGKRID
jgi:hypothetical protein